MYASARSVSAKAAIVSLTYRADCVNAVLDKLVNWNFAADNLGES